MNKNKQKKKKKIRKEKENVKLSKKENRQTTLAEYQKKERKCNNKK